MKQILIATKNAGKVKEFEAMFSKRGIQVKSLLDYPNIADIAETGNTFAENASLKAESICQQFNEIVIADDSGLSIDALNGRPGVYSARYAGESKDDKENNRKVLQELNGVPFGERTATFHCALALAIPGKATKIVEGLCPGVILEEPLGENGFGYDPLFYLKEKDKTMAQLTKEEKNKISHRAKALEKLNDMLDNLLKEWG